MEMEAAAYGTVPLAERPTKALLRRPDGTWKRGVLAVTVTGLVLFALLGLASQNGGAPTALASMEPAGQQATATAATGENLAFSAVNKYTSVNGPLGGSYPWVQSLLLEPHRENTFSVSNARTSHEYNWVFAGVENAPTFSAKAVGKDATVTFTDIGTFSVTVTESLDGKATRTLDSSVIIRYVRRELRSLDAEDRHRFFDAAQKIWSIDGDEGVAEFGAAFAPIDDMVRVHNSLAGDHACDHMHDGMGFMTQHAGLTYLFERALQAVDPSVAMVYWDWTVDVAKDYEMGLNNTAMRQWDVFGPDFFGTADTDEHTVTTGRFAYSRVKGNSWGDTHNPYGFLRAPWNMNSRPFVTRYDNLGSVAHAYPTTDMGMPTCMDFMNMLMNDDTWFDFAWALPYDPHARVHSVIGGSEAGTDFDVLAEHLGDDVVSLIAKLHFYWTKNMWRNDKLSFPSFCSSDTPQHECRGECFGMPDAVRSGRGSAYIQTFGDTSVIQAVNQLDADTQVAVLGAMCTSSLSIGENMESASPSDISFWPIHPNLERIWTVKKLSGTFQSEDWPVEGNSLASGGATCWGHAADDVLPYGDIYGYPAPKVANLTNQGLYDLMNPIDSTLPYIYDDLTFSHCKIYDMDFSSWLPKVDRSGTDTDSSVSEEAPPMAMGGAPSP